MLKRVLVRKNERAILLRDGDFERFLPSGRHALFDPFSRLSVTLWRIDTPMDDLALIDLLQQSEAAGVTENFEVMALGEDEAGLRYENDQLVEILAPCSRRVFVKGVNTHRLDKLDLRQSYTLPKELAARLLQPSLRSQLIAGLEGVLLAQVPAYHVGVLKVDGKVERLMDPGTEAFWRFNREIQVELIDQRLQTMEVSGQEILTRDKVSLRLNLAATWRFTDVLLAFAKLNKPMEHLYRELQLGLRCAVGTRSLDELLENKQTIDEVVSAHIERTLAGFGLALDSVGVKDIVLPGEMKAILAQVVEAEKSAQANVIRRREETAATRSLLNTAKIMEENPTVLRLKELETLERVAEKIDKISVFGGLDQVLNGLVHIKPN